MPVKIIKAFALEPGNCYIVKVGSIFLTSYLIIAVGYGKVFIVYMAGTGTELVGLSAGSVVLLLALWFIAWPGQDVYPDYYHDTIPPANKYVPVMWEELFLTHNFSWAIHYGTRNAWVLQKGLLLVFVLLLRYSWNPIRSPYAQKPQRFKCWRKYLLHWICWDMFIAVGKVATERLSLRFVYSHENWVSSWQGKSRHIS